MSELMRMLSTAGRFQEFAEKDSDCPADLKEHIASLVCIYWGSQQDQRKTKLKNELDTRRSYPHVI